jgi:hypothetical protein
MNSNLNSTVAASTTVKRKRLQVTVRGIAAASALALMSSVAGAAETTFIGYTDGCFGALCVPPVTPVTATQSISSQGLTYNNSTFSVTTAGGFVAIGGSPGAPNLDNLGSFTLSGLPAVYTGTRFNLGVVFTAPSGISPNTTVFEDVILGTVVSTDHGGVFINFDNSVKHYTFGAGPTAGYFDFFINDLSIVAGRTVSVSGTIVSMLTPVPEPGTYAMLLAGLGMMGFIARRRMRSGSSFV